MTVTVQFYFKEIHKLLRKSSLLYNYAKRKNVIQCYKLKDIHDGMADNARYA